MNDRQSSLGTKVLHELREMAVIAAYLALCFGAVATYRLFLPEPPASYAAAYGFALIKALVLAKVILLGQSFAFTRLFEDRALLVSTAYKVAIFSLLAFAFETVEHLFSVLRGRELSEVIHDAVQHGKVLMARTLVVIVALVPFFALREVSRVLGEGRLADLFLHRPEGREKAAGQRPTKATA
jgi:hypothetical protein